MDYYDSRYATIKRHINPVQAIRLKHILSSLIDLKLYKPRIIDLGCGTGWLSNIMSLLGPTVGVDSSNIAIEHAKKSYAQPEFINADILKLNLPDGSFDVVVSQEVIEHFTDQKAYIDMACRLLKPEGILVLTTPNARTFKAMRDDLFKRWVSQPVENLLGKGKIRLLLKENFRVIKCESIIFGYGSKGIYRYLTSRTLRVIIEKMHALRYYERIAEIFGFGLHILVVARKK